MDAVLTYYARIVCTGGLHSLSHKYKLSLESAQTLAITLISMTSYSDPTLYNTRMLQNDSFRRLTQFQQLFQSLRLLLNHFLQHNAAVLHQCYIPFALGAQQFTSHRSETTNEMCKHIEKQFYFIPVHSYLKFVTSQICLQCPQFSDITRSVSHTIIYRPVIFQF